MKLSDAQQIAELIVSELTQYCEAIEIVGSIRRESAEVKDIDILLQPKADHLEDIKKQCLLLWKDPDPWAPPTCDAWGKKVARFKYLGTTPVDLYFATHATWPTLELIRTGSAEHNIMLCAKANKMGLTLHASGAGLFKYGTDNQLPDIVCEADIFKALQLDYVEPKNRER